MSLLRNARRRSCDRRRISKTEKPDAPPLFRLHPLFLAMGVWYACTGELFLFLMSTLVALQHECAHAFAAAKLGYKLNQIVLMPFGAVIDGDLRGIGFKEEITVAMWGPLCNLLTAAFFAAIWWFKPTVYAFTDTACYSSLSIALINLLPAYPLDGGRILRSSLARTFLKTEIDEQRAERKAEKICRLTTLLFAALFVAFFLLLCSKKEINFTLLAFAVFLVVGAFGNKNERATYAKMDFSRRDALKKGVEIKRVAILNSCPIKKTLGYLSKERYLILEVYDENENHLFNLSQNELSSLFLLSNSPFDTVGTLAQRQRDTLLADFC